MTRPSKEKRADIWMPLYVADYLADTSHLSTEEHGAYLLLLMNAWTNDGNLPLDDERLRRITRMDAKSWKASGSELRSFFYEHDSQLRNHRIDAEIIKARNNVAQRSKAGKASAEKRRIEQEAKRLAEQNTREQGNENSTAVATSVATEASTNAERNHQQNARPSPSPTPFANAQGDLGGGVEISPVPGASEIPPPPYPSPTTARANEIAALLRQRGAALQAQDPRVLAWVASGKSDAQLLTALELAKQRREDQCSTQPISAGYLDTLLEDGGSQSRPATASRRAQAFDPSEYVNRNRLSKGDHDERTVHAAIDGECQRLA